MPGEMKYGTYPRTNHNKTVENNRENSHNSKDCSPPGIFENGRFCHSACNLLGCVFRVQTNEGKIFEGVLQAFNTDFEVALGLVHEISGNTDDELPREGLVREKMIFSPNSIVTWSTVADLEAVTRTGFATDTEISRFNGEIQEKQLEAWEPDHHDEEHILIEDDYGSNHGGGWTAEDMFKRNTEHFGVVSTYVDDLTQFSNVELSYDVNSPDYHMKLKEAERIARSIEANPASKKAADLENDDEERDILPNRSSVSSVESSATTPSNAADTSKSTYIPPNRRRGGGHPSDRGGPRAGGRGGGQSTPRSGVKGRDEYTGGNISYYNSGGPGGGGGNRMVVSGGVAGGQQKYQQFQQPPMQQQQASSLPPPHVQHERSPGAAIPPQQQNNNNNNNFSNDWERRNNQQRRDNAAGYNNTGGGGGRQFSHSGDGAGMNPNRRVFNKNVRNDREQIAELKKFGTDFKLVPTQQQQDVQSQGVPSASSAAPPLQQQTMQQQTSQSVASPVLSPPQQAPPNALQQPPLPQRNYQQQRSPPRHQQQQQIQKSPESKMPPTNPNLKPIVVQQQQQPPVSVAPPLQQRQPPPPMQPAYLPQQQIVEQEYQQRPPLVLPGQQQTQQQVIYESRPSSTSSRVNAPLTPTDSEKSEPTLDIRKSKLNPDAKEFCPSAQFYRPTPVQTPAGSYPVQVQSPQSVMPPIPPMSPQQQQPPQQIYATQTMNPSVPYPPPTGGAASAASNTVTFIPGNSVPFYTINQPTMAVLHTNGNYRPQRKLTPGQPQAVAAATGQPIMTAPYPTQTPYFVHYPTGVPSTGQTQSQSTYQPTNYIFNPRMQYVVHPTATNDGTHQPVYMVPQLVQVTTNPYQTATAVVNTVPPPPQPPSVPPPSQQQQSVGGNSNNHAHSVSGHTTQTPPAPPQTQQVAPPLNNNVATVVGMQASYPPTAQTPQSPQYPVPPTGGYQMVVLPPGGSGFVATGPQMYGSQNSLAAAAAAAAAAGGHHGHVHPSYQTATQTHYVPADAGAPTAYMQFPTIAPFSQTPSAYAPHLMRSSSVTGFIQQNVQTPGQTGVPPHTNMA